MRLAVLAAACLVTGAAAVPTGAIGSQIDCTHLEVSSAIESPAVVGIPVRRSETFWCLEAGDRLSDAAVSWGDGTSSIGAVSYSKPEARGLEHGLVNVLVESAVVTGTHVYLRPTVGEQVRMAAIDEPSGMAVTSALQKTLSVVPRDVGREVTVHATRARRFHGVVARVLSADSPSELTATIAWGHHRRSQGEVIREPGALSHGVHAYLVKGSHLWLRDGEHPVSVVVADEVGPQNVTIHSRAVIAP